MLQEGRRSTKGEFGNTRHQGINSSSNVSESLDLLALTMDSPPVVKKPRKEQQQLKVSEPTAVSAAKNGGVDQSIDSVKQSEIKKEKNTKGEYEDLTSLERQMFADIRYT